VSSSASASRCFCWRSRSSILTSAAPQSAVPTQSARRSLSHYGCQWAMLPLADLPFESWPAWAVIALLVLAIFLRGALAVWKEDHEKDDPP
jgi:hypothetical protein